MVAHQLFGSGPLHIIALHGWFGSAAAWRPLTDVLDPAQFSIACMDYRGYGARIGEPGQHTLEEIAADALQLADELGWRQFHLMGHSMGGKAIQRLQLLAPSRVERLLAITPVPASGVPFDEPTWALFSSAAADIAARRAIIDHSTGSRLSPHWVAKTAERSWHTAHQRAFADYLQAWAKGDFAAQLAGTEAPLHVVLGEHDPSLNLALMQQTTLHWCRGATAEVVANAGHYPADETPLALAAIVERWFAPSR